MSAVVPYAATHTAVKFLRNPRVRRVAARVAGYAARRAYEFAKNRFMSKGSGINEQPPTQIPRNVLRNWNQVPMRRRIRHRYIVDATADLTSGAASVVLSLKADNVANVTPGATTSVPAVGFTEMRKIYQSYVVVGSKVVVKILKQAANPNPIYARIRLLDGLKNSPEEQAVYNPDTEWSQQVRRKPWKKVDTSQASHPNRNYEVVSSSYSYKKVRRQGSRRYDVTDSLSETYTGDDHATWAPIHLVNDDDKLNVNDRFFWQFELSDVTGVDPSSVRYLLFAEYITDWFDPKEVAGGLNLSDEVGVTVPEQYPYYHNTVAVSAPAAATYPDFSSIDDPDPANTP